MARVECLRIKYATKELKHIDKQVFICNRSPKICISSRENLTFILFLKLKLFLKKMRKKNLKKRVLKVVSKL